MVLLALCLKTPHNGAMWFWRFFDSLSLRVLVLTIGFVILSEAIILIPSMAAT